MATSIYEMSVEQRQREYEKEGLPSWKIAEWEAEVRRVSQQEKVVDQAVRHGMPNLVGSEGDRMQFSDPTGVKRTFSPGGDQTSLTIPSHIVEPDLSPYQREQLQSLHRVRHGVATGTLDINNYKDQYSPRDQKNIEKLYQTRSEVSTNPELTPEERQQFMDKIDSAISRVPRLSPIMQEPTPQQKFEASIVTDQATGQRGIFDLKTGKFNPLVDPKAAQAETDKYNERFFKNLDAIRKDNADPSKNLGDPMDDPAMVDMARAMTDNEMGKTMGRRDSSIPEMDAAWSTTMADLNIENGFKSKKASEELMLAAMDQYVKMGIGKNMREVDVKADFLQRWESALGGGPYQALVPKMSPETRNKAQVVKAGTVREDDAISQQYGLGRGESKVTVHNQELPPELDAVWGSLSNSDKKAVRKALADGANKMQPMERRMIKVEKGGEQFYVPILQIGEAKAEGYTVVE